MRTLILELITLVVFWPLRIVSRLFGRRANARVRDWQDHMWTWGLGGAAIGYMAATHHTGGAHHDDSHDGGAHHDGGGFDGGFGGDIGSF